MNKLGGMTIIDALKRLTLIFAEKSTDRRTLDELHQMAGDRGSWSDAHDLFQRIRRKTIEAERLGDAKLTAQYAFEEACAKTLYNLQRSPAPFDPDSPYWIIPNALVTARHFEIDENKIVSAVISI
jgi:hypothetical protein